MTFYFFVFKVQLAFVDAVHALYKVENLLLGVHGGAFNRIAAAPGNV